MQRLEIQLEDDLTGGPADETVQFAVEGTTYELDLSAQHAADLRRRLAPFIRHARRARRRGGQGVVRTAASRERSRQIRSWAEQQGFQVAAHGRLPADVITQYEQASAASRLAAVPAKRTSQGRRRRPLTRPQAKVTTCQLCATRAERTAPVHALRPAQSLSCGRRSEYKRGPPTRVAPPTGRRPPLSRPSFAPCSSDAGRHMASDPARDRMAQTKVPLRGQRFLRRFPRPG